MENDPFVEDWDVYNPPVPQQAYGNENGIMYQIHPTLLNFISGNMSVSQQPKGNNRSRYACDGRRFLPDSRYHPMTIQVRFLLRIQKIFSYDFECFSYRIYDQLHYKKAKH